VTTTSPPVVAAPFSANWPPLVDPRATGNPEAGDVGTAQASASPPTDEIEEPGDMPLVWPILTAEERAAFVQLPEPAIGMGHLLILLAAVAAFTAIAFRAILKLVSTRPGPRRPRLYSARASVNAPERVMPWLRRMPEAMHEADRRQPDAEPDWRSMDVVRCRPWAEGPESREFIDRLDARAARRKAVA
jgi:hypothetical protein